MGKTLGKWLDAGAVAAVTGLATVSYLLYLRYKYESMDATIRVIWEGDHLIPEDRDAVNKLFNCQKRIVNLQEKINEVKRIIELEKLNSISEDETLAFRTSGVLLKKTAFLNSEVDKLASAVDMTTSPRRTQEVLTLKKKLSKEIVELMGVIDKIIAIVKEAEKNFLIIEEDAKQFYEKQMDRNI